MKKEKIIYYHDKMSQAEVQAEEDKLSRVLGAKVTLRPISEKPNDRMKETVNGIEWEFKVGSGEAMITSVPACVSGAFVIPSKLGGADVTCAKHGAFNGCTKIESVTIPNNFVATVDNLEESSNGGIWSSMFKDCCSLREIKVSKRNPRYKSVNGLLMSKGGEKVVAVPHGLTEVKFPKGVTKIGDGAFEGCCKLKSVTMPNGVMEIEWNAFKGCSALENITIPNSVRSIKQNAFMGCCKLKKVTIPSGVKEIEPSVFWGCTGLREIVVATGNSPFESINGLLLEKDAAIADSFFGERREGYTLRAVPGGLMTVTIPDGVTYIDIWAFRGCSKLKSVTIPSSVTGIDFQAFYGCSSLENVIIPEGVAEIGEQAFENCTGLKTVTIPKKVKVIGDGAFDGCADLKSVTLPASLKAKGLGRDVFPKGVKIKWVK